MATKRTNPKLIGAFGVGAIVLLIGGVMAFGGGQYFKTKRAAILYFQGSLGGLSIGSPVEFRGIKVGTVTNIVIEYDVEKQKMHIPVFIEIEQDRFQVVSGGHEEKRNLEALVERGLRAQLVVQSLVTGQAVVEFDMHPNAPNESVIYDHGIPELPTVASTMSQLTDNISEVLKKVNALPIEKLFDDVRTLIDNTNGVVTDTRAELKPILTDIHALVTNL